AAAPTSEAASSLKAAGPNPSEAMSEGPGPGSASSRLAQEGQEADFVPDYTLRAMDMGPELVSALAAGYMGAAQEEARNAIAAGDGRWDTLPSHLQLTPGEAPPPDTHRADMMAMKGRECEQDILDYTREPGVPGSARQPDMGAKRIVGPVSGTDPRDFTVRARASSVVRELREVSTRLSYDALLSDFLSITVGKVVPALYGRETAGGIAEHIRTKSLTSAKERLNVRGALREEGGTTERRVVMVAKTPLDAVASASAMRARCGLYAATGDVAMQAPAARVIEDRPVGTAVHRDQALGGVRVGQLVGHCDFGKMLACRLDKEAALVVASAVDPPARGSAGAADAAGLAAASSGQGPCPTFTMEHVAKLSKDEATVPTRSLAAEWKAALTAADASDAALTSMSAMGSEYWSGGRSRKV
ncbi:unnamed protein product, partial [Prorocentrum cordatum]